MDLSVHGSARKQQGHLMPSQFASKPALSQVSHPRPFTAGISKSGIKYLCGTARAGRFTSRTRTLHTMAGVITSALTTADTVYPHRYGQVLHTGARCCVRFDPRTRLPVFIRAPL